MWLKNYTEQQILDQKISKKIFAQVALHGTSKARNPSFGYPDPDQALSISHAELIFLNL